MTGQAVTDSLAIGNFNVFRSEASRIERVWLTGHKNFYIRT